MKLTLKHAIIVQRLPHLIVHVVAEINREVRDVLSEIGNERSVVANNAKCD